MANYNDLYDILQGVDTPVKVKFFLDVQFSVSEKLKAGLYDGFESEVVDDLIQFSEDMDCEGYCEFSPVEESYD